jgi:hypothetical protein
MSQINVIGIFKNTGEKDDENVIGIFIPCES